MLEEILFGFGDFLAGFVFSESEASAFDTGALHCEDEVIVVLPVDAWSEVVVSGETEVNESVFLVMAHWGSDVNVNHGPLPALES